MLENLVYKILDLTYPKLDTSNLPNLLFKLNSTQELIYLGEFIPYDIDKVLEHINQERKNILLNIKSNSKDLGFTKDEIDELNSNIEQIITYKDFLKEYKSHKHLKNTNTKDKFIVDEHVKKEAFEYAKSKINIKTKKFDLTPKEIDRYEEKYIKEYISKAQSIFKENQTEIIKELQDNSKHFLNRYSEDIQGYKEFIKYDNISNLLKEPFNFFIPTSYAKRHTYISGMTGSGKSELLKLLIYSDILKRLKYQKLSTVIIEPHGDLSEEIIRFTENYKNDDLIYICPNLAKDYTVTINPFEMDIKQKSEENIDILASELIGVFKIILGSSFTLPMESVLLPCITTILYLNNPSNKNYAGLEELQRFMDDNHNKDLIEFAIKTLPNPNQQIFFKSAFRNKSLSVTKQALYTKIQTLLNSNIFSKLVQGKSTINLEKELNQGRLVVINLSKGLMGDISSKFFGALIIALINHIVLKRVHQTKEYRTPINLIIDESQNYLTSSIEVVLTELRKYGLHLTLVNQIVGQNSNTQLEKILLSNTNIKIVGMNATDSLEKLSKEIQIPTKELQKLTVGEFFIKLANKEAIKFKSSTMLLNNENQITISQYNETKKEQLERYYKKVQKNNHIKDINNNTENKDNTTDSTKQTDFKPRYELPPE